MHGNVVAALEHGGIVRNVGLVIARAGSLHRGKQVVWALTALVVLPTATLDIDASTTLISSLTLTSHTREEGGADREGFRGLEARVDGGEGGAGTTSGGPGPGDIVRPGTDEGPARRRICPQRGGLEDGRGGARHPCTPSVCVCACV